MKHAPALLLVTCLGALLSGCGSEAVYIDESFANDSPFKLKVSEPAPVACESARRSLLGQGYLIDTTSGEQVKGRKAYRRDDSQSTFIEMNVVCIPDRKGSTLYANGVLNTYDLKKSGNSASVGISAVGSISLPIGQSADSLVKIAEETIEDKAFYGRFFAAVGHVLKEMEESPEEDEAAPGNAEATAPEPAPEADIPLEPGPASVPGIVPEPGPAPTAPATGAPQPVVVPEPGAAAPSTSVDTPKPAAPGPVQGFSVSAPASLPHAQPAAQPQSSTVPAPTPAPQTAVPSPQPSMAQPSGNAEQALPTQPSLTPAAAPSVVTPPAATPPTRVDAMPAPSATPASAPSTTPVPATDTGTVTTPKAVAPEATTSAPSAQPTAAPPT